MNQTFLVALAYCKRHHIIFFTLMPNHFEPVRRVFGCVTNVEQLCPKPIRCSRLISSFRRRPLLYFVFTDCGELEADKNNVEETLCCTKLFYQPFSLLWRAKCTFPPKIVHWWKLGGVMRWQTKIPKMINVPRQRWVVIVLEMNGAAFLKNSFIVHFNPLNIKAVIVWHVTHFSRHMRHVWHVSVWNV